jgi:hypothetical protein
MNGTFAIFNQASTTQLMQPFVELD